ncbi:MAG: hypothetical protein IPH30_17040 [Betaproteobacteria bacterium]|nr:hypothetical protein [Betaproteobacteria bacterium]
MMFNFCESLESESCASSDSLTNLPKIAIPTPPVTAAIKPLRFVSAPLTPVMLPLSLSNCPEN